MAPMSHSVEIARSPEDVFAYVVDPTRFKEWQDDVVSVQPEWEGPMTVGSRFKLTRKMGGREQTMTSEMTEYSPPHSYAFRIVDGSIRAMGRGVVQPVEGGTSRFDFELDFEGRGAGKLMLPLLRKAAQKDLLESHDKLKQRLEGGGA